MYSAKNFSFFSTIFITKSILPVDERTDSPLISARDLSIPRNLFIVRNVIRVFMHI